MSHSLLHCSSMADRDRPQPHQVHVRPQHQFGGKTLSQKGPSSSKVLAVITLLPVGGTLLGLAGLTFIGTLIGLAVTTPLFVICSPVLVPVAITIGLVVLAFLASGALGVIGLSSLSWAFKYFRQAGGTEQLEQAKKRMQDMAAQMGQQTKDVTHKVHDKAQEAGK
ncbi:unnamed protein product [Ilex paraguariensis]|uniref:Oleosin n=1 Tax=Ilex paraguariensis TaxID=185542 RepID=A0ABC8U320_9AQUA